MIDQQQMDAAYQFRGDPAKITVDAIEGAPKWDGAQWLVHPMDVRKAFNEDGNVRQGH